MRALEFWASVFCGVQLSKISIQSRRVWAGLHFACEFTPSGLQE